jgi:hypothetical protein
VHPRTLASFGVRNGSQLECEDFLQKLQFRFVVQHRASKGPDVEFRVSGELKSTEDGDDVDAQGSTDNGNDGNDDSGDIAIVDVDEPGDRDMEVSDAGVGSTSVSVSDDAAAPAAAAKRARDSDAGDARVGGGDTGDDDDDDVVLIDDDDNEDVSTAKRARHVE